MSYFDDELIGGIAGFFGGITGVFCFSIIGFINSSIHNNLGPYFHKEFREIVNTCVMGCYFYLMTLHTTNIYGFLKSCNTKVEALCNYYFWSFFGIFHLLMTMYFGLLISDYPKELYIIFGNFWVLTTCHLKNTLFPKMVNKNKHA